MGKLILVFLLLFQSYSWTAPDIGGQNTGGEEAHLSHFMELMEQRWERGPVPIDEQIKVLENLGLTLSDETISSSRALFKDWENEGSFGYEYWLPLMLEGSGAYDYELGTWTPSSSQVYAYDAEFFDVEGMYQIFLQGLQSISEGELTFTDISTDYSGANFENRGGTVEVRFKLNGTECRYKASFMGDWLDMRIRNEVNRCLEEQGIEKRFYAIGADQGEIIFFCTEAWAQEFEAATLCYMRDTAEG